MYSEPNNSIFWREDAIIKVNVILRKKIEVAKEARNYGSNLTIKAYNNSKNELLDSVLLLNFLLKSVNLLDSIIVLSKEGCHSTIPYFTRGLIENSFYIEWLLTKNSKLRAEYFYTYIIYKELETNAFAKENPEEFIRKLDAEDLIVIEDLKSFFDSTENQVEKIKDHFKTHFPKHYKRLKNKVPAKWYSVKNNLNSLGDIAEEIDRKAEYEIFYKSYSKSIHSSNIRENFKVTDQGGKITPIRSIQNLEEHFKTSLTYSFRIYRHIIQKYIPMEEENFSQIYRDRWRKYFAT